MSNSKDTRQKNPNVPTLRFSEWDDPWHELPLQEICSFEKGSVLSKSDLSETGLPCILYGQLYTTYLSETINEIVSKTNRLDDSIERSQVGDLIIPCSGETPEDIATARCVMVPDVLYGGDLNVLRSKHHDCSFLSYQLNGKRRMDIARIAVGKTIVHLHGSDLKSLRVWVPSSLEEERKIASLLNLLNRRIAVQNKIIEAYESLINPLFNVLNACEKKKISLGKLGVYRSADNLSWDEISGKGDPTIIYGELFTTYQLIARDIKSLSNVQIASTSSGRDILFPASTTVDSLSLISPVALYEEGVKLGGDMFFISLKEEYDPLYISLLLNLHCKRALSKYAQGSTIIHLHFEDIENFTIFVPDEKKQREISTRILHILDLIDCERKKLKLLLKQKQFFLNELFI